MQGSQYHADIDRTGSYVVQGLTWNSAATIHRASSFGGLVAGKINAEPLYWLPPDRANGLVIVATDQAHVTAIDSVTGSTVWDTVLSAATPLTVCAHGGQTGVAGTPVIDSVNGIVYVDSVTEGANNTVGHGVFALSATTGAIMPGWPLDIATSLAAKGVTFASALQGQRAGLNLVNGVLYVPFGGNGGDCRGYHGTVVAIDVAHAGVNGAWVTGSTRGGIWGQGGVVSDGKSMFFATGNADEGATWADGNAIFRLRPNMKHSSDTRDYFVPSNFAALDSGDLDLGGSAPLPIDVPGPLGVEGWLVQFGKDGNAYVLDRDNLRGMGGALLVQQVATSLIRTGPARYTASDSVYVAFNGAGSQCPGQATNVGLTMLRITAVRAKATGTAPVVTTQWCASLASRGSAMITTTDGVANPVVWIGGAGGDFMLHGYRVDTGQTLFNGGARADRLNGMTTFSTILGAENRLYVGGTGQLYAYDFTPNL